MDRNPVARVYYLTNTTTPLGVQEILSGLRIVGDIQQVYNCDEARLIAFRGTAAEVDLGDGSSENWTSQMAVRRSRVKRRTPMPTS
jgi:hypothetical protein